jgi:predicted dithiol-disulfide oxidoreductase (DUF899 family)
MFGPSYQAGDPVNSSIADTLDALAPHLQARDVTVVLVSQAPLAKLQAYRRRMGWRLGWVSAAPSDFNVDIGASVPTQGGEAIAPPQDGLPPIVAQNAAAAGTDIPSYLTQAPVVSAFVLQDGVVYQSYTTSWRGVEVLMGYYPVLDRVPKGRDEGDGWQLWLRRHTDYDTSDAYRRRCHLSTLAPRRWLSSPVSVWIPAGGRTGKVGAQVPDVAVSASSTAPTTPASADDEAGSHAQMRCSRRS